MVGALINAGGTHTHVFSTDEATTLYRQGLEMFTMSMEWEDLDTILFAIVFRGQEDESIIFRRLGVADMHHASVTYLDMDGDPDWNPEPRVASWLQETEGGVCVWHTTRGEAPLSEPGAGGSQR